MSDAGVEEQVDDVRSVKLVLEVGLVVLVRCDVEEQVGDEVLDDTGNLVEMMN